MFARTLRPCRAATAPRTISTPRFILPFSIRSLTTESATQITDPPVVPLQEPITKPEPAKLPYYVGRNRMNNIAVYERRDRGGNLKKTLLKKGEGNLQALRFDVAEALGLTAKEVKVNNITNHIEIRGHRREDVVGFLKTMGF